MPSNLPMNSMLNTTYLTLISTDQTRLLAEPFFADYAAVNGGRKPFVDPVPLTRWAYGYSLPEGAYEEALANKSIFMNWFAEHVVPANTDSCSDNVLVYPQSSGTPNYRNTYHS